MVREFAVSTSVATLGGTGANTLIFVNPIAAPNLNLEFLRFWVGQFTNPASSAQQRIQLINKSSVFPTMQTGFTPVKLKLADAVSIITAGTAGAAGTAGVNATAEGAGTATVRWDDAFNVLNGWLHVPTPPESQVYSAGATSGLGLYFPTAPGTVSNWSFGLLFREV